MDTAITLSRLQFGLTAGFHIIFPTLLIGLSTLLSLLYVQWMRTSKRIYLQAYTLWLKVLFVIYLVGAVSGVALSVQLDNVFGGFYSQVKDALVPIRNFELIFAILLEGGCIGVMLLCLRRERSRPRLIATLVFNFGIFLTAFFVISRNSWMNTPVGYEFVDGELIALDRWAILFNPSFPLRYLHMIIAGLMASSFFVLGLSALRQLRLGGDEISRLGLRIGIIAGLGFSLLQFLVGDLHGLNVLEHQPMKVAAMEGQWETEPRAGFKLFAVPDRDAQLNRYEVEIPGLLSLLLHHDLDAPVQGLKQLPREQQPNVPIVFYSFRIMILCALAMLALSLIGLRLLRAHRLAKSTWFLYLATAGTPLGLIAVIAGWTVAEVARQPWVIYGVVSTADTVTATSAVHVAGSMMVFGIIYTLFAVGTATIIYKLITAPPPNCRAQAQSATAMQ